jgi:hypothetical protein
LPVVLLVRPYAPTHPIIYSLTVASYSISTVTREFRKGVEDFLQALLLKFPAAIDSS